MTILIVMAACFISRVRATKLSPNCWICHLLFFSYIVPVRNCVLFLVSCFEGERKSSLAQLSESSVQYATNFCVVLVYFPLSSSFFVCVCCLLRGNQAWPRCQICSFQSATSQLGRLLQFSVKWCDTTYARKQSNIIRKKIIKSQLRENCKRIEAR